MQRCWLLAGIGLTVVMLALLLTILLRNPKRRLPLRKPGFPADTLLTRRQAAALRAFEDTDMRLRKSLPGISNAQRAVIARDVLRDQGMLPRRTKSVS
ncbi:MAG: hypothetical protein ACYC9Z_14205 [Casimicrobiaceae bacterium]